jgi:hypothetical protein
MPSAATSSSVAPERGGRGQVTERALLSGIDLDLDPDTVWSQSTCTALVAILTP